MKCLKRVLLMLTIGLLFSTSAWAQGPSVILDGKELAFDVPPVIENGRTLVPFRAIFEALGATINWDEKAQTVTATKGSTKILLVIGSRSAISGTSIVALDVPAKIVRNRTLVPLRFVSESLGANVSWNGVEQKVEINSQNQVNDQAGITDNVITSTETTDIQDTEVTYTETTDTDNIPSTTDPDYSQTDSSNYWDTLRNFAIDPGPTDNSKCVISGEFSDEVKWVWIQISKDGDGKDWMIQATDGKFLQNINLPFGQGEYAIKIFANNLSDRYADYHLAQEAKVINNDTTNWDYLLPSEYVQSDNPEITELAKQITQGLTSDMEKTKAIHDWVATHIAYDTEAYFSGNSRMYSALDTLQLKRAVCNGYANLNAALHRAVGIKAKIISGTAIWLSTGQTWDQVDNTKSNHAWNEVYVNGDWIIEDATWDAGGTNFDTQKFTFRLTDKYFNPDPVTFAEDHYKIEELDY